VYYLYAVTYWEMQKKSTPSFRWTLLEIPTKQDSALDGYVLYRPYHSQSASQDPFLTMDPASNPDNPTTFTTDVTIIPS
jgi:hypothetical protein